MTSVLTAVCIKPRRNWALPTVPTVIEETVRDERHQPRSFSYLAMGPLIIQEALQEPGHAGYIGGLGRYFGHEIVGKAYFIFVDTGDRYHTGEPFLSSDVFFPLPTRDEDPVLLRIGEKYRESFDFLLNSLLVSSSVHEVLILCEYNGNVTWIGDTTFGGLVRDTIQVYGPWSTSEFWEMHDDNLIEQGSIIILHAK